MVEYPQQNADLICQVAQLLKMLSFGLAVLSAKHQTMSVRRWAHVQLPSAELFWSCITMLVQILHRASWAQQTKIEMHLVSSWTTFLSHVWPPYPRTDLPREKTCSNLKLTWPAALQERSYFPAKTCHSLFQLSSKLTWTTVQDGRTDHYIATSMRQWLPLAGNNASYD